jgi:hypothetical protein
MTPLHPFPQNGPDAPHSPEATMSLIRVVAVAVLLSLRGHGIQNVSRLKHDRNREWCVVE